MPSMCFSRVTHVLSVSPNFLFECCSRAVPWLLTYYIRHGDQKRMSFVTELRRFPFSLDSHEDDARLNVPPSSWIRNTSTHLI